MDGSNGFNTNNNQEPTPFIPPYENNNSQGYDYQNNSTSYSNSYDQSGYGSNQDYSNYNQQQQYNNYNGYGAPNGQIPGKGQAVASLVLGIVSIVFWFFGVFSIIGLVTGIIGVVCATNSKKQGYVGGMQTAGLVCSIIGTVGCGIAFVACLSCYASLGSSLSALDDWY